ncbi:MAG: protein kinase [Thermoanaerobaculia bacterium]|nr:protein kinase [Thermoanaerobaculia bacterium]
MDPTRWQRIDRIFAAALERPPHERSSYLDRECGRDPELRRDVESLLASDRDDDFLERPASEEAAWLWVKTARERLVGERVGRFEVLSILGAGGMGEVYLAHDPKLERKVALKAVPRHLANDPERIRRFRQEALAISALNHPNIVTVHEMLEHDGRELLVIEWVEGVTLRERLRDGRLPVAETLEVAAQMARGLTAAHSVGIVHGDVKPGNVMIRGDGLIKLLDFGLARSPGAPARSEPGPAPVAGTVAYMSPEQASGGELGPQADIWALGCVLFEMLSGRRAFEGESVSDLLTAIRERDPDLDELPETTPFLIRRLVRRCLAKDPADRLHHMGDVRLELEEAIENPGSEPPPPAGRSPAARPALRWTLAALAALGAASIGWWLGAPGPHGPGGRFQLQPPPGVELVESYTPSLAIAPDGRGVAFVGVTVDSTRRIYIREVDALEARPLPGTDGATNPFFSPDGLWLGFQARGSLRKIRVDGGEPVVICEAPQVRGASWGDTGTIVFSMGEGLFEVSAQGGAPRRLTRPPPQVLGHFWPRLLPGGRAVLFLAYRGVGETSQEIVIRSLKDGREETLVRGASYPAYGRGHLVFHRTGTLYAARLDPERLALAGEPRAVLDGVHYFESNHFAYFDLARSGDLVFAPGGPRRRLDSELVELDGSGSALRVAQRRAAYGAPPVPSPDGTRLAVVISSSPDEADVWTYEPATEHWTRRTADGRAYPRVVWSRDGRWLYFSARIDGALKVFRVPVGGIGDPEQLTEGKTWEFPVSISADDRVLLVERAVFGGIDLYTLEPDGDRRPRPWLVTPGLEQSGRFSPEGGWVAYQSDTDGASAIYVRAFSGESPPTRISTGSGTSPQWSPDGGTVLYLCPGRFSLAVCATPVKAATTLSVGRPRTLFDLDRRFLERGFTGSFEVAREGQRFFLLGHPPEAALERQIVYVPGWAAELASTTR